MPISHHAFEEVRRFTNPFVDTVVQDAFDLRSIPEAPAISSRAMHDLMDAVREHRTDPNDRPMASLMPLPIIQIAGATGAGKSHLLRAFVREMHDGNARRFVVPISPAELIAAHTPGAAVSVLVQRIFRFLFASNVPRFSPMARPLDVLATRFCAEALEHLNQLNARLPGALPRTPDLVMTVAQREHLRWPVVRNISHHHERAISDLANAVPSNAMVPPAARANTILMAAGMLDFNAWRHSLGFDDWQQLETLVALSNLARVPITLVFDQFESLQTNTQADLRTQTRAFIQQLISVLSTLVARAEPIRIPLCILSLVDATAYAQDRHVHARIPILPNGRKAVDVDRTGFDIHRFDHVRELTRAYLQHFWDSMFGTYAAAPVRDERPPDDFWPFGENGLQAMHERRGEDVIVREWLERCQREWRNLVNGCPPGAPFAQWHAQWLEDVRRQAPIEKKDKLRDGNGNPPPPPPPPSPPPPTPQEFLLSLINSPEFAGTVAVELRIADANQKGSWIWSAFRNLTVRQAISDLQHNTRPFWFRFRRGDSHVMATLSNAMQRGTHKKAFEENLQRPYDTTPALQGMINRFVFLSIGNGLFDEVPAFHGTQQLPVTKYLLTDEDWRYIFAIRDLHDPAKYPAISTAEPTEILAAIESVILSRWPLFSLIAPSDSASTSQADMKTPEQQPSRFPLLTAFLNERIASQQIEKRASEYFADESTSRKQEFIQNIFHKLGECGVFRSIRTNRDPLWIEIQRNETHVLATISNRKMVGAHLNFFEETITQTIENSPQWKDTIDRVLFLGVASDRFEKLPTHVGGNRVPVKPYFVELKDWVYFFTLRDFFDPGKNPAISSASKSEIAAAIESVIFSNWPMF